MKKDTSFALMFVVAVAIVFAAFHVSNERKFDALRAEGAKQSAAITALEAEVKALGVALASIEATVSQLEVVEQRRQRVAAVVRVVPVFDEWRGSVPR